MKIHALSTGQTQITESWRVGKGNGSQRLFNTLFDSNRTAWLPIHCFVIEHPDGLTVVDTGIPTNANAPIWFPPWMRLVQRAARFQISPDQEIGPLMRAHGLDPQAVRRVILTHLHQDHEGGLHYFQNAEFMVSRVEWQAAIGTKGRLAGYQNQRWFKGLAPTLVDMQSGAYGAFAASEKITSNGDLRLVPTPGHSVGHMSVIVEESAHIVFIAGDASYSQELLLRDAIDGIGPDPAAQRASHHTIRQLASQMPMVFLPTHDPDTERRLAARERIPVELNSPGVPSESLGKSFTPLKQTAQAHEIKKPPLSQ